MHKTNSAVVEQYAFPFLSPPVNRVSPSSETDSEQEGFLYHAVVPRRITTRKKFELVFFEGLASWHGAPVNIGWTNQQGCIFWGFPPVWQFGSRIVAGSQGCIYLCDQVPRVYHGFPGPVCCSQGCSARNQLPPCGCQRSRRSPCCGIARVCDVRTTLSFRFLIPSWEDKSHCRKQTIHSSWH